MLQIPETKGPKTMREGKRVNKGVYPKPERLTKDHLPSGSLAGVAYFFSFFFFFNYLINFRLRCVFVAACSLSLDAASGGCCSLRSTGFSLRWLLLLQSMGSRCAGFSSCGSQSLEHRLSSCSAWLSCSAACEIFPDQGSSPCPLHWQADS